MNLRRQETMMRWRIYPSKKEKDDSFTMIIKRIMSASGINFNSKELVKEIFENDFNFELQLRV